jgi:glycosyltransferase involved in cell wall biosynthesis
MEHRDLGSEHKTLGSPCTYKHPLNTPPKVVIACAWYQRAEYIRGTVDSLLAQDYGDFEIVIVNDGSPDPRVREILDSYNDPRLNVIHQENTGFTVAIKRAIAAKDSPYFCVMGSGDRVAPEKLAIQVDYLQAHPQVGAVGSGHVLVSAKSRRRISYRKPMLRLQPNVLRKKVPFTHGTIMYRRSQYETAGGYDPFFRVAQDRDLYWRLSKISEIHGIDKPLYEKYLFAESVTFQPEMVVYRDLFARLAKSQNREEIEMYRARPELIPRLEDAASPRYLRLTAKRVPAMIIRQEWGLALQWSELALRQIINGLWRK